MTQKLNYVCSSCKSEDVVLDAYAKWNKENQKWVLGNAYETAYCNICEADTRLQELTLEEAHDSP